MKNIFAKTINTRKADPHAELKASIDAPEF